MHSDDTDSRHSDPLNQNHVPDAFVALHTEPGRTKPSLSRSTLLERHAWCEDMAQLLTEHAATLQFSHNLTEAETLRRVLQGLLAPGEAPQTEHLQPLEALWVVCRLAELLGWPLPSRLTDSMGAADMTGMADMQKRAQAWLAQAMAQR